MPSLVDWRAAMLVRGDMMLNDMSLTGGGGRTRRKVGGRAATPRYTFRIAVSI
jgi:hypothetical protein